MNLFGIHPVPWSASDRTHRYRFAITLITEPVSPVMKCPTVPADAMGTCLQFSEDQRNYMEGQDLLLWRCHCDAEA